MEKTGYVHKYYDYLTRIHYADAEKQYDTSLLYFQKLRELAPYDPEMYYDIGRYYSLLGNYDAAFNYLQKSFEMETVRKLDKEREKIKEEAVKIFSEDHRLKDAEKDKKLQDAIKANEELHRKLQQGSQQTQGEVLELELEELLKTNFPLDTVEPVPKGIRGADVLQKVYNQSGQLCGMIVWESKYTKAWSNGWVPKLKDDQREIKADIAILITEILPKDVNNFAHKDFHQNVTNFLLLIYLLLEFLNNKHQIYNFQRSQLI